MQRQVFPAAFRPNHQPRPPLILCGLLRCCVARARKHEKSAPFVKGNLRDQVRGVAKTIDAEPSRISRFAIGTITDQSRAKQRCNRDITVAIWQMKAESRISDGELGVTAVDCVPGKTRVVAEILPVRSTINAFTVRPTQPRNAYAISDFELRIDSFADFLDTTDDLMPRDQRELRIWQFAIDHMKISATNSARIDAHEQLPRARLWPWHIAQLQGLLQLVEDHRAHGLRHVEALKR